MVFVGGDCGSCVPALTTAMYHVSHHHCSQVSHRYLPRTVVVMAVSITAVPLWNEVDFVDYFDSDMVRVVVVVDMMGEVPMDAWSIDVDRPYQ